MVLTAVLSTLVGCSSASTPSSPIVPSVPAPQPRPPQPATAARLALSKFTITVVPGYTAAVRFVLTETGGLTGATIETVTTSSPQEADITGASCWKQPIHVNANSTLDVFDTGWSSLSYCAPDFGGPVAASDSTLMVKIDFVDDSGARGSVMAVAPTIIGPD